MTHQAELPASEIGKDRAFQLVNVMPGKYKAVVEPMSENEYVKSIILDGKPAANGILDLSQGAGGSRVKIAIAQGGQISGRLLDQDGAQSSSLVLVLLQADSKKAEHENVDRGNAGNYSLKAIRPGKYRILALDVLELLLFLDVPNQPELMKPFYDVAEEIEIKDGDRLTKDLTVLTKAPEKK